MFRFRRIIGLESIVVAVSLFMLLVPVVGLFHSCPANGCSNTAWPAWNGSITFSLWGFGVAVGGNYVMTFTLGTLGEQFIFWSLVALVVVPVYAYLLERPRPISDGHSDERTPQGQRNARDFGPAGGEDSP